MPEVCEIVITTNVLNHILKNGILEKFKIISGRYTHNKLSELKLLKKKNLKFIECNSKGKFLWITMKSDSEYIYILNTFGLTGFWNFEKTNNSRISITIINRYDKKIKLYYNDQRNFGTFNITNNINILNKKLNQLAYDLLKTDFDYKKFNGWIEKFNEKKNHQKMKIVQILLNQNKNDGIGSGIGNYLVCEILYKAKISPYRTICSLNKDEIKKLCFSIKYLLKLAYLKNPTEYMDKKFVQINNKLIKKGKVPIYHKNVKLKNEKFQFLVYRQKKDPYNNKVIADKIINGRKTYWSPKIQI